MSLLEETALGFGIALVILVVALFAPSMLRGGAIRSNRMKVRARRDENLNELQRFAHDVKRGVK